MKRAAALALVLCATLVPALAKDKLVTLTLNGRSVDRAGGIALLHDGVVYADAVDLVKTFNGLVTFGPHNAARIEIRGRTGTFVPGNKTATIGTAQVAMPGAAFMRNGDLYVPLVFFISHLTGARVQLDPSRTRADIRVNSNPLPNN
ncbi:MAG: stalk domain-containing protein [Candidatus Velthaea sp.]|jgi:hypothetical protein